MPDRVPRCPVCKAAFREAVQCPRCGADLRPLMEMIAAGWRLRQQARRALGAGEAGRGLALAQAAAVTHETTAARDLVRLASLLMRT